MRLELVRLATIYYNNDPAEWRHWTATIGQVGLETHGIWDLETRHRVLIAGKLQLEEPPSMSGDGIVGVPTEPREEIESAIELMANAIAVAKISRRSISSPPPFVALVAVDDEARQWLDVASGFSHDLQPVVRQVAAIRELQDMLEIVAERREGVQLLAEALSQDQLTGRYHDLLRVMERAFALKAGALKAPLNKFYEESRFKFTPREVAEWIDIRGRVTHADRQRALPFALEADVRPFIARMELGAYDVLFNKRTWRSSSPQRLDRWTPTEGTEAPNTPFLTQHVLPPPLQSQLLDPFSRYPADLSAGLAKLPDDWWSRNVTGDSETETQASDASNSGVDESGDG